MQVDIAFMETAALFFAKAWVVEQVPQMDFSKPLTEGNFDMVGIEESDMYDAFVDRMLAHFGSTEYFGMTMEELEEASLWMHFRAQLYAEGRVLLLQAKEAAQVQAQV